MHQADGDPRIDRVEDRTLSLDPEEIALLGTLDDEALGGAREEVRDHRVDRDPPPGDRDPRLPGRDENRPQAALARLEVELARRCHLPDRAVGTNSEDDRRVGFEVRSGRSAQVPGRLAQIAQLDTVLLGQLGEAGNVVQANVEAVLEIETLDDAAFQQLLPVAGEVTALRDDADERGVRTEGERVVDGADDRDTVLALAGALRVEHRDDRVAPVTHDSARGLRVVRIVRELFSEDQVLLV